MAATLAVLSVRPARAQSASCSPMAIEADASVTRLWPGLVSHVREALEARDDIDRCAHVELTSRNGSIILEVTLPDGRFATRSVSRREDLVSTLAALLLEPQRSAEAPTSVLEPSLSMPPQAAAGAAPPDAFRPGAHDFPVKRDASVSDRDTSAASSKQPPAQLRIELSVMTGARIGDGRASLGLGVLSYLDISGWLVGFEARGDRYQPIASSDSDMSGDGAALELAVLAGRRFRFENLALDLVAGPAAAMQGTSTFETKSATTGTTQSTESSSGAVPRLLVGARLTVGARSLLRAFVGIDGEAGPSRGSEVPGAFRLPLWTLGLALGATVGTR